LEPPLPRERVMMTNIEANMKARGDAEQMIDLCGEQTERFWEHMAAMAVERCGKKLVAIVRTDEARMTDAEASQFERTIVPFGKYAGEPVSEVPIAYWTYVTESEFNRQLVRYMRSDAYQRRQDEPE
jgi:hypothetical protein